MALYSKKQFYCKGSAKMAIVCRKCKYKKSKQEINQHCYGFLLNLANNSIKFLNNLFSLCRKAKIEEDSEVEEKIPY